MAVWVLENADQVAEREKNEEMVERRTHELSIDNIHFSEPDKLLEHSNENLERFS